MNPGPVLSRGLMSVLFLAILLNYIDRGNLATASPLLQDQMGLTSAQIGVLLSAFFWTYAPSQLLAGWLVHRFDIRIVLGAGVAIWATATACTGLAGGFASILLLRLVLGLGESVTFPACQLLLSRHTPETVRGRANGLLTAAQGVGPMIGTLLGGLAMAQFGWRAMFVGLGAVTLLWLWPWAMVTRRVDLRVPPTTHSLQVPYVEILRQRSFWGAATGHFCANYSFYFVLSWLPTFLVKAGGFTVTQMALSGALVYGIYATATALSGVASDAWVRRGASITRVRKTFILTGSAGSAFSILGAAYVDPRDAIWLLGMAGVFFGIGGPMIFGIGTTIAGPRAAGRWTGAQNLAGQCAGIVAPLVTGFIVSGTGSYTWAFVVSAALSLLGMAAWGILIRRVEEVAWAVAPQTIRVATSQ